MQIWQKFQIGCAYEKCIHEFVMFSLTQVQLKKQQNSISWFFYLYVAQKQRNDQPAAGWQRFQHPTYTVK